MLSLFKKRPCASADPTVMHLERKLQRYERRTKKPNAQDSDYRIRDRLAVQLMEARSYLC